ncbi:MAG: TlpA disulfide reductase family protein [Chloroflexota bacterium]|nr:TlpA family protein disulfide reductase [Chloroflexota bacterium]
MKKVLMIVVSLLIPALLLSSVLLTGCASSGPATEYGPEVGKLAPDFKLIGLDKQEVSLSGLRGKPVLLNFWATWCGPCRIEMPFLQEIYEEWTGKGLVVLAVNVQENPTTVKKFVENAGLTFPVLLSPGNDVPLAYNIRGIPATFLIDADGVIRDIKIGAFFGVGEIESKLAKIMP